MHTHLQTLTRTYPLIVVIGVLGTLLFGPPTLEVQAMMAALGVVTLGLPHGAADLLVARDQGFTLTLGRTLLFVSAYLALAALAMGLWLWMPHVALGVFLAISAWHFAGDWAPTLRGFYRMTVGTAILASPAIFYEVEVALVFASLVPEDSAKLLAALMFALTLSLLPAACFIPFQPEHRSPSTQLSVAATLLSAVCLPPLLFFLAYFCIYHSPKHLAGVLERLKPLSRARVKGGIALNVLLALPLMGAASWLVQAGEHMAQSPWLQFAFVGLFTLTIPHMALEEVIRFRRKSLSVRALLSSSCSPG